jgi:hypothetical protein
MSVHPWLRMEAETVSAGSLDGIERPK